MLRYALPVTLAAALWTTALVPSSAQDKPNTKKPDTAKPAPAVKPDAAKPDMPKPLPPKPSDPNIVGSVNGKNILFMQVIERLRRDNPDAFKQAVAQAVGVSLADQLFGDKPQTSVTITQDQALATLRDKPNPIVFQTFQRMLESEAIAQAAAKESIVVTDAQTNEALDKIFGNLRKAGRIPAGVTNDQFLTQQKLSRAVVLDQIRPQLQLEKLKEKDPQLQKAYQQNAEKIVGHALTPGDFLKARHILVMTNQDQGGPLGDASGSPAGAKGADAAALAKINKIAMEVKSGKKTFEAAAQESSDDTGSKGQGGDLGVFLRGMMVPEFTKAAFAANPGEITGPIKTQFGYHLIKVEKLGKDLTEDERKNALTSLNQQFDQQNPQLVEAFRKDMEKKVQVVSYMTPPAPTQPVIPQGG